VSVAYEDKSGQEVAVKTFDPGEDGSLTTETLREISALRVLEGVPGVAPLCDVAWELSGLPAVSAVLPLYRWTVADAIEDGGYRGAPVLQMVVGVLRAVAYLHACTPPLVHRDIKPENVMLDDTMDPILIDFSFCKFLEPEPPQEPTRRKRKERKQSAEPKEPKNTGNLGTPTYVAPEVLEARAYDARVDVWSMGVMFLEALQKKRLDTDRDKAALRMVAEKRAQLTDKPVPAALRVMLDPDFTKRSTSAEALVSFVAAAKGKLPAPTFPAPIRLDNQVEKPRPDVTKLCAALGFRSPHTASAASHYLNLVGRFEAGKNDVPLYATLVAGKLYEQECLDSWGAEDELGREVDSEEFADFEENLLRLSGCCLFTPCPL
jgi:serine/threonine protein kinase